MTGRVRRSPVTVLLLAALVVGPLALVPAPDAGAATVPGGFEGVTPVRLLDTREAVHGPCVAAGESRSLVVTGIGFVPASASAVVLNVTVTGPTGNGFVTVYPDGVSAPTASSLNFVAGQTVPNAVTVKVGAGNRVNLLNSSGCSHLVVDVVGYYTGGAPEGSGGFTPMTPTRALDTREPGQGPCLAAGVPRQLVLDDDHGVPAGASGVVLNVTVTGPTASGYLTVYPSGTSRPTASNLNFVTGQTVPNAVTVKLGTGSGVELFGSSGCTHAVVDVVGYYTGAGGENGFVGLPPGRLLDTRQEAQGPCLPGGIARSLDVTGVRGVSNGATAVVLNVTVTEPTTDGWLTVYPTGITRPTASNLNFVAGQTVPNAVTVKVGPDGMVRLYGSAWCAHVVVDVVGFFGTGLTAGDCLPGLFDLRYDGPANTADNAAILESVDGSCTGTAQTRTVVRTSVPDDAVDLCDDLAGTTSGVAMAGFWPVDDDLYLCLPPT